MEPGNDTGRYLLKRCPSQHGGGGNPGHFGIRLRRFPARNADPDLRNAGYDFGTAYLDRRNRGDGLRDSPRNGHKYGNGPAFRFGSGRNARCRCDKRNRNRAFAGHGLHVLDSRIQQLRVERLGFLLGNYGRWPRVLGWNPCAI